MKFKYDFISFFDHLGCFMLTGVIIVSSLHYIFKMPIFMDDLFWFLKYAIIASAFWNLYDNITRAYRIINSLTNILTIVSTKKEKQKLTKAYPKYGIRSIPLYKENLN